MIQNPARTRDSIDRLEIGILSEALSHRHDVSLDNFVDDIEALNNLKLSESLSNLLLLENVLDTRLVNGKGYSRADHPKGVRYSSEVGAHRLGDCFGLVTIKS